MDGWALITHPEHLALVEKGLAVVPSLIQERDLHWALGQGWIVIGRDSEVYAVPVDAHLQSNPRRVADQEDVDG